MLPLDETSAEDYLRRSARLAPDERVSVRELAGGVSNMVLLVERPDRPGEDFVLKQARAKLRTELDWYSDIERVWREADVLTECARLLARAGGGEGPSPSLRAVTPRILFEDRENYLFAMAAAPRPNTAWKQELLAGRVDVHIASACGRLLGTLHAESWQDNDLARRLGDRTLLDQLRIDPYYRTLAVKHPEIGPSIDTLIDSLASHPRSLVHADFSPKNLLVFDGGLMMVDFETGHFGDPAFDLGFFLSHLVLKACLMSPRHGDYLELTTAFRASYDETLEPKLSPGELSDLWARGVRNFAACAWARLDGKSPVEYLTDASRREVMSSLCRDLLASGSRDWSQVVALCRERFA